MRRALFALLAILLSVQFTTAHAATRVLLGERVTGSELDFLNQLANSNGVAEVIVGLNVPFAPEGTLDQAGITVQRQEIAQATAALSALLSEEARASIRSYQSIPFMAVRVSSEDLDRLAGSNRTRSIQRDYENEPAARVPSGGLFAEPLTLPQATPRPGDGQVIAVIDTGVLATHAAFTTPASKIVHQACFSRDGLCSSACNGTTNGCEIGTHVAGIAAGSATGFSGVAPGAQIMSIRVFSLADNNSEPLAWDSDILSGLEEVLKKSGENSIAAVTLGFNDIDWRSFPENCDASRLALKAAIDNLKSIGIATIAASGDTPYPDSLTAPGCISSAVSVSAVSAMNWGNCRFGLSGNNQPTAADTLLCTSNISPVVSLLAPGAPIRSSIPGSAVSSINIYGTRGGTAMAAAQVAGAWAVLKQKAPEASVESILGVLKSTGVPIASAVGTFPRIDIPAALKEIEKKKIVYTREGTGTGRVTFTAGAQACDLSCERTFLNGGQVTLTAAASPGSVFAGWSGACEGTSPTCTVQVSNAIPVTATFNAQVVAYPLTVNKTGNGQVSCNDGACAATYPAGTPVTLKATPDTGWQFASWTGCAASATTPTTCSVTLSQARTVTASFSRETYPLTVNKTGNGQVSCNDGACAATYPAGTPVTLKATPDTGWQFASWTGCTAAATTPDQCTLTLSQARTVTATFTQVTYPLTINKTGNGQVSCGDGACAATYPAGTPVTLKATPDTGWQFASWTGCTAAATTPDQCTVTLSQARTVTARFSLLPVTYPLTVNKTGNGQVSCGDGACAATYPAGTPVTLKATPDTGWQFASWTGCAASAATPDQCTVTLSQARTVAATFTQVTYPLTISTTGNGQVSCGDGACAATYPAGTPVTLKATPDTGWQFASWTGCAASAATPDQCTVTLSQARTVAATFTQVTYPLTINKTGNGQVSCGDGACAATYPAGTPVTLKATPDTGWQFASWTGCTASAATPDQCTVTLSEARTVTASFSEVPESAFTISYTRSGSGAGNVTFTSRGRVETCADNCREDYDRPTLVQLVAAAEPGSVFIGWQGDCSGTRACIVALRSARSVTAMFERLVDKELTFTKAGTGDGTLSVAPLRGTPASCVENCTLNFGFGTALTLTAVPSSGSVFTGWSGACSGARVCTVTMDTDRPVTANFEKIVEKELVFTKAGTGDGTLNVAPLGGTPDSCVENCTRSFAFGTTLTLTAIPRPGSVFTGWSGDCAGARTCSVTMDAARPVTAIFDSVSLPTLPTLTYVKAGSGSGSVSFEANRRTEICDSNCTKEYPDRSRVMLLAMPERGSVFVGWQGDCRSNRYCIVAMTGARSVTAVFEKVTLPVLSYENSGTGSGSVAFLYEESAEACEANCTKEYPTRSLVRLVATPSPGSVFVGWQGDCSGSRSCLVSMTGDRSVTAIFDTVTAGLPMGTQ